MIPLIERRSPAIAAPLERASFFAIPAIEKITPKSPVSHGIPGNQQKTKVIIPITSPAIAIPLGRFSGGASTTGAGAEGSGTGVPQLEQTLRMLGIYEPHLLQYIVVTCSPLRILLVSFYFRLASFLCNHLKPNLSDSGREYQFRINIAPG